MAEMVQRKLVGAARYMSPLLGDSLIEKGTVVTVSEEVAAKLDEDTYVNGLGEVKKYFVKVKAVADSEEVEDDEEESDAGVAPKRARTRAAKPAKAQKVEAGSKEEDAGEDSGTEDQE
jgi:hypothetical protein